MPATDPVAAQMLDRVYAALIHAKYAELEALTAQLEQELQRPSEKMTEQKLQIIRRKAERNAVCLQAAQRGIKAARRRVSEIKSTASGLVTYDRSGQRSSVTEGRNLAQRF